MTVGETDSLGCKLVEVGRFEFGVGVETAGISIPLVIGVDHDDVWFFGERNRGLGCD